MISNDPKSVTKIGIKKSSSFVISIMIIAAEKVFVNADRKVAVPHRANNPGWILNPNFSKISPNNHPKIEPIIKTGVIIPLGIAKVVSMNRIIIHIIVIKDRWAMIDYGQIILSDSFLKS